MLPPMRILPEDAKQLNPTKSSIMQYLRFVLRVADE